MKSIIVTVTDCRGSFFEDMEIPVNVLAGKLKEDMVQALNGYRPELFIPKGKVNIYSNRAGRNINDEENLEEAGVWNGDYLTLIY